jgi:hypothetical protein
MEPFSLLLLAGMKTSDVLFYVEPAAADRSICPKSST